MQSHASTASERKSKYRDHVHENEQKHTQKNGTYNPSVTSEKKMTCAFWDLEKYIVDRIDAPEYRFILEKAL